MSPATHRMRDADFTALSAQSTLALRSSNRMPVLGLGTWQLKQDTVDTVVSAIQLGFRMIDTSGDYGTHAGIGAGMRHSGVRRDELYVTTKVEETDDAYLAARKNLGELQLDYVDLLLIHRPPPNGAGEDLWRGLMRAKQEDLTRDIGVSNYSIEQIDALDSSDRRGAGGESDRVEPLRAQRALVGVLPEAGNRDPGVQSAHPRDTPR